MKVLVLGASCVALLTYTVSAQSPSPTATPRNFDVGYTAIGPVVGLGGIGGASLAFGGRFERAVKALPDLGGGILGIGIDADFYQYSSHYFGGSSSFTYIPFGVSANYHFKLDNAKWDPFLGLGLGYSMVSISGGGASASATSGIYAIARGGVRYFWSNRSALQVDAGAGAAALSVGVVFKL
jgi:hypothetical protein